MRATQSAAISSRNSALCFSIVTFIGSFLLLRCGQGAFSTTPELRQQQFYASGNVLLDGVLRQSHATCDCLLRQSFDAAENKSGTGLARQRFDGQLNLPQLIARNGGILQRWLIGAGLQVPDVRDGGDRYHT